MAPAIVWFRRNLRLDDNVPLDAALRAHEAVVPVFVLDDHYLAVDYSPPRLQFLSESLAGLEADLASKGSRLLFRKGPTGEALAALARETGADAVYGHDDHEPHGRALAREAEAALAPQGTKLRLLPDLHLVAPGSLRTEAGRPFAVYTPFSRRWREAAQISREEQQRVVSSILATRPSRPDAGHFDSAQDLANPAHKGSRKVQAYQDWKTGQIDYDAVRRLESLREQAL